MDVVNPIIGGLSNAKLAQATATSGDVSSGKTFYAGNGVLKTGTGKLRRTASGSFEMIEGTNTIECGFRPTAVFGYSTDQYSDYHFVCGPGISTAYTTYDYSTGSGVAFTSTGFTITPPRILGKYYNYTYTAYA